MFRISIRGRISNIEQAISNDEVTSAFVIHHLALMRKTRPRRGKAASLGGSIEKGPNALAPD